MILRACPRCGAQTVRATLEDGRIVTLDAMPTTAYVVAAPTDGPTGVEMFGRVEQLLAGARTVHRC